MITFTTRADAEAAAIDVLGEYAHQYDLDGYLDAVVQYWCQYADDGTPMAFSVYYVAASEIPATSYDALTDALQRLADDDDGSTFWDVAQRFELAEDPEPVVVDATIDTSCDDWNWEQVDIDTDGEQETRVSVRVTDAYDDADFERAEFDLEVFAELVRDQLAAEGWVIVEWLDAREIKVYRPASIQLDGFGNPVVSEAAKADILAMSARHGA